MAGVYWHPVTRGEDCMECGKWRIIPAGRQRLLPVAVLVLLLTSAGAGEMSEAVLTVRGMFCSSCAATVEKALKGMEGVAEAKADLAHDRVRVRYRPELITVRRMSESLKKWGYELQIPPEERKQER